MVLSLELWYSGVELAGFLSAITLSIAIEITSIASIHCSARVEGCEPG